MNGVAGSWTLLRLALRRERVIAPIWVTLIVLIVVGMGANYARVFPTDELRQSFANEMARNRVLLAFAGQVVGSNLGALTVWRIGDTAYTLVGLLSVLTVVRHTRAEEESGRFELVGAAVVGRYAPLTVSLGVACAFSGVLGALVALGLAGLGFDAVGSIAFGLAVAGIGCVFAALGALASQLTDSARTATVIGIAVLGCSYLVRFVADGSGQLWLKWWSPHGWSHLVEPFGVERWWVLGLMGVAFWILAGAAFVLIARRDLGAGVLPSRPGPANGPGLRSPLALAWRLQRGLLGAWVVGFAIVGIALGGMAATLPDVIRQSGWGQEFLSRYSGDAQASIVDIFLELIIVSLAMTAAFYPILATLRLRTEEAAGGAELVLSTAVGRVRWVVSHLVVSMLGTVAVLAAGGAALGLTHGLGRGNAATELGRVLAGALLHVPAAWLLAGIALLLLGVWPRYAVAGAWAVLLYVQLVGEVLGPVLLGPAYSYQVANALQPFHWIPKLVSGGALTITPLLVLTGLTVVLVAAGLAGYRRRDIAA